MEEKKCPKCGEIIEDASKACPNCGTEPEEFENIETDTAAEKSNNYTQADDSAIENDMASQIDSDKSDDTAADENCAENITEAENAEVQYDEDGNVMEMSDEKKTNKTLFGIVIALGVIIVALIAFIIIGKFSGVNEAPKTISVSKFEKSDIAGLYKDPNAGFTFEFTAKETEVTLPSDNTDETADSSADSAADSSAEKKEEQKTEKHDGTFVGKYDKDFIVTQVIKEYISSNDKQDDYKKYLEEKKIADDDYKGYAKARKLDSDIKKYDEDNSITKSIESYVTSGTWKYDSDKKVIKLYDDSGADMDALYVTENGLVESMMYFKGEIKKNSTSTLVYNYEEQNVVQTLKLYENGDCLVSATQDGKEVQSINGTYKIQGDKLILTVQDSDTKLSVVDGGVAMCVYNK